jgi:hypothetical protein
MDERGVLTIASGKQLYLNMASALARSFRVWHSDDKIALFIATDAPQRFPADVQDDSGVRFIDISSRDFGQGFENKLYIDELLPAQRTLFIDADCLVTGSLDPVFEAFEGRSVSVVGGERSEGEWFGDLRDRCDRFEVSSVPVFVGAVYYVENSGTARKVFETAREVRDRYDKAGFVRLRGLPNEEPLISVGMALHDQTPIRDDGTIKADAMHFGDKMCIDVLDGKSYFRGNSERTTAWGVQEAEPIIAHFNDSYAEKPPYIREQAKLKKIYQYGASQIWASTHAALTQSLPFHVTETVKDLLRPVYRALWGSREIRNERVG